MPNTTEPSTAVDFSRHLTEFATYEESGMRACAAFLADELKRLGFIVRIDRLSNVFGEKTFDGGDGTFLINTHFDTVGSSPRWSRNPLRASLEGERLYGLGTSDAKGGIAGTLQALIQLKNCRFRKLEVLFSNYEDNNVVLDGQTLLGTPYFLEQNRLDADFGINVEGTVKGNEFMVSLGCGGRVGFTVTTLGKEAHSSDPRKGHNAIYDMMMVIQALRQVPPARMTVDNHEAYTELNVSIIQGGTAINIVPAECKITCERRVLPNENWDEVKKEVDQSLSEMQGINFKVEYNKPQRSYIIDRTHPAVSLVRESVHKTLGYLPKFRIESGRTDSTYIDQLAGIKTVIFGPGDVETAHIPDEFINVSRLEEFSRVLHHMLSQP